MGQKIHPVGLRLGISQQHRSIWFAKANQYASTLHKDQTIRQCISQIVSQYNQEKLKYAGIASVKVQFNLDLVEIELYTAYPSLIAVAKDDNVVPIRVIRQQLQTLIGHQKLKIVLTELDQPYIHAILVGEYVALQLESRIPFRKAMKKALELAKPSGSRGVQGIKIQVSGRLNGAEIARVEWARKGRVPLHTLRAQIDYCHCPAHTIYGVLGIKVWIFK